MSRTSSPCGLFVHDELPATPPDTPRGRQPLAPFGDADPFKTCRSSQPAPAWGRIRTPSPEYIHRDAHFLLPPQRMPSAGMPHGFPQPTDKTPTAYAQLLMSCTLTAVTPTEDVCQLCDEGSEVTDLAQTGVKVDGNFVDSEDASSVEEPKSIGSIGHPHSCAPACKYATKRRGCKDGAQCNHCHECIWISSWKRRWQADRPKNSQQPQAGDDGESGRSAADPATGHPTKDAPSGKPEARCTPPPSANP